MRMSIITVVVRDWPEPKNRSSKMTKKTITVKGKKYGYFVYEDCISNSIRSEDNPHKTPYLKQGSKKWAEVRKAIEAAENENQ